MRPASVVLRPQMQRTTSPTQKNDNAPTKIDKNATKTASFHMPYISSPYLHLPRPIFLSLALSSSAYPLLGFSTTMGIEPQMQHETTNSHQ